MDKSLNKKLPSHSQKPPKISSIEEEKFMTIMKQIGDNTFNDLSAKDMTEVINQRGKIVEYVHEENMQEHERFKIIQTSSLIQLGALLGFAIIVLCLVAFVDKAYLPQALTLIIGFVGGFGVGKTLKDPQNKKD